MLALAAAASAAASASLPLLFSPSLEKEQRRWQCVALKKEGHSNAYIARRAGLNPHTVAAVIKRYRTTGSPGSGSRSGRPRATTEEEDTHIALAARVEPFSSPRQIRRKLDLSVSRITVSRRLNEAGLKGCVARRKPGLNDRTIRARLSFAEGYADMDWTRVLFSDEKIFWGDGFCGRTWVRRPRDEALNPAYVRKRTAHPVKVNVWACFASTGQGFIHIFNENLDGPKMKQILKDNLIPSAEALFPPGQWYFLHDNDKKFHSKVVQKWLHEVGVTCLDFPPYSPDLNPIENLWAVLQREVEKRPCSTVEELQDAVAEVWENASQSLMERLAASMPRRMAAVVTAAGSHTKY